MTPDILALLFTFAFTAAITPGPNNVMLIASGANFGFRRTVPHMAGIALGHPFLVLVIGLGLIGIFDLYPPLQTGLRVVSVVYLLYLAWKIANAAPPKEGEAAGRPLTFLQAAGFQWVNPKAWTMAMSAITIYAVGRDLASVLWVCAAFLVSGIIATTVWTRMGVELRRFLSTSARLRAFNWTMAALLVASLALVLVS
jgi:threonine/homoserine/homoserine lactone efflux protein